MHALLRVSSACSLRLASALDVSHNAITGALPAGLAGCRSLEELDASHNAIESVPGGLGSLHRLRSLVLDANRIGTLPVELLQGVPCLTQLSLHDQQPPLLVDVLRALPGWAEVEKRTAGRNAKKVAGVTPLGSRRSMRLRLTPGQAASSWAGAGSTMGWTTACMPCSEKARCYKYYTQCCALPSPC
jgi:hypothetical protein